MLFDMYYSIMTFLVRMLRVIIYGRWAPIEAITAIHLFITGLWLILPWWSLEQHAVSSFGRGWELSIGILITFNSIMHFVSVATKWSRSIRKRALLLNFSAYCIITTIAIDVSGFGGIRWLSYATLALLTGLSYMALVINGD